MSRLQLAWPAAALLVASVATPSLSRSTGARLSSSCHVHKTLVTRGFGQPDDMAVMRGVAYFGDIKAGVVARIQGHRAVIVAKNLDVPEGIGAWGKNKMLVVEQGKNRIDLINLKTGHRSVFLQLLNTTGEEGVDSIGVINGRLIIPNSPYGTVLRWYRGKLATIAQGLNRPTSAWPYRGGIAIADEYGYSVWLLKKGHKTELGSVPEPDDVAAVGNVLLAVTLNDGGLWEVDPVRRRLLSHLNQPQGLVTDGRHSVLIASSGNNAIYRAWIPETCG